jgi:hypothetical protein
MHVAHLSAASCDDWRLTNACKVSTKLKTLTELSCTTLCCSNPRFPEIAQVHAYWFVVGLLNSGKLSPILNVTHVRLFLLRVFCIS